MPRPTKTHNRLVIEAQQVQVGDLLERRNVPAIWRWRTVNRAGIDHDNQMVITGVDWTLRYQRNYKVVVKRPIPAPEEKQQ